MRYRSAAFQLGCAIVVLIAGARLGAQELRVYGNGLIYDSAAVRALRILADSVQRGCAENDFPRDHRAAEQTSGQFVSFKSTTNDLRAIAEAMRRGDGLDAVMDGFSDIERERGGADVVIRYRDTVGPGTEMEVFEAANARFRRISVKFSPRLAAGTGLAGTWVYVRDSVVDDDTTHYYLSACHLDADFATPLLPREYSRLIAYADCLVDTATVLYVERRVPWTDRYSWRATRRFEKKLKQIEAMVAVVKPPRTKGTDLVEEYDSLDAWRQRRDEYIRDVLYHNARFIGLVGEATAIGIQDSTSAPDLQTYALDLLPKGIAFELMRRHRPFGTCSLDDTPRRHAYRLAALAAELGRWDLFLRAHLDLLNDAFDRMTDCNEAWPGRGAYTRELEALGIDVPDLLLGIALSSADVSPGHYTGNIGRLGRAIAASADAAKLEERILAMIHDKALDPCNRSRMYWLYMSYLYNLSEKDRYERVIAMKGAIDSFPLFLLEEIENL